MQEYIKQLFDLVIWPLVLALGTYLVIFIRNKSEELKNKNKSDKDDKYIDRITEIVTLCVITTTQTYVDSLKKQNAFDKILLTGPAGIILRRGFSYHCKVRAYRLVKKIAPKFAEKNFGSKEYRLLDPIMKESYKKIVNEDLSSAAKRVKNQVLIVEGTRDRTTTMKEAEIYLQSFPHANLKTIEGGHFSFVENPLVFNFLAEEFFYG
jgi:hypothetical protein